MANIGNQGIYICPGGVALDKHGNIGHEREQQLILRLNAWCVCVSHTSAVFGAVN